MNIKLLAVLLTALFLQACTSSRGSDYSVNYNSASKLVFINTMENEAHYFNYANFSADDYKYPVDWGIPELVEVSVKSGISNAYVDIEAPDWLVGINLKSLKKTIRSEDASQEKLFIQSACTESDADVAILLGSFNVNWGSGGVAYWTNGYGLYVRSGAFTRPHFSYAIPAAAIINCTPFDYQGLLASFHSPAPIDGFKVSKDVSALTPEELAVIKTAVLGSLQNAPPGNKSTLDMMTERFARMFNDGA